MTQPKRRRLGRGLSSMLDDAPVTVAPADDPLAEPTSESGSEPSAHKTLEIDTDSIVPNKYQPRSTFEASALKELADSIREAGIIQPVVVRPAESGKYELIAGERRWRAAQLAELRTVPAVVRDVSDGTAAQWALIENVQREDLNAIERARAFERLVRMFNWTHAQVAQRVGLERSSIANQVRLLELESSIQTLIEDGMLGAGHGKALLAVPSGQQRLTLAKRAVEESLSVREIERLAKDLTSSDRDNDSQGADGGSGGGGLEGAALVRRAMHERLEKRIGEKLGSKVRISTDASGAKGTIAVSFFGIDHFEGLLTSMGIPLDDDM